MATNGRYIVLHIGNGPTHQQEASGLPLIVQDGKRRRFQLDPNTWIERLGEQFAKRIQKACEPPHYKIKNVGYDRHLYAFVSHVPDHEKAKYEGMSRLHAVIALSRLVNPTSTGDRYCALAYSYGAKSSPIFAIRFRGVSPDVSLSANSRDWLTPNDGKILLNLIPWLSKTMHPRVHRAYWNHENAMRSYYLDIRWTLVVTGFEALINTSRDDVTWQFRDRVRQLANMFGIRLSDSELQTAYSLRSKLIHGQDFLVGLGRILPTTQHSDLYERLERLLRETILRCLLDPTFYNHFHKDATINAFLPLGPNPNRKKKRRRP